MKSTAFKKLFLFLFCFVVLAVTLAACKSASASLPETTSTVQTTNTEKIVTVRDTVFKTQKDSSYYKAYLECVNGKVQVKGKPETKPGNHLKPPAANIDDDNVLTVNCYAEAQELFAQWKETYIKQVDAIISKTLKPVEVERDFTWWELTLMGIGKIAIGILIIFLIYILIKTIL